MIWGPEAGGRTGWPALADRARLPHGGARCTAHAQEVQNLEYASPATVLFQRLSVTATDVVYLLAAFALARCALTNCAPTPAHGHGSSSSHQGGAVRAHSEPVPPPRRHVSRITRSARHGVALFLLLVLNAGLLLVDHIHFQYNGVVIGETSPAGGSRTGGEGTPVLSMAWRCSEWGMPPRCRQHQHRSTLLAGREAS